MSTRPDLAPGSARWIALGVMLCAAAIRCMSQHSVFPYWDIDPTILALPQGGLTPKFMATLDVASLAAAAVLLLPRRRVSESDAAGVSLADAMLLAAGLAVIVWHIVRTDARSLEQWSLGLTWAAAWAGAFAVRVACANAAMRQAALAAALPLVLVLVLKGVLQITLEHAETLRGFNSDRSAFLAAQGWSSDSEMARGFERRLSQAEASGWFGLANVFAAFAATGAAYFAWMGAGAHRGGVERGRVLVSAFLAMAAACGAGVWMAGSKQGYAAVLVGLAMPLVLRMGGRVWPHAPRVLMLGVPMGVLAIVAFRGVLGDQLSELSLRFRWFYLEGATRIFLDHPWAGVGPGSFKDAYLIAKNPLNPEEVSSPHNLLLDLASTLGIGGIALAGLWLRWLVSAAARAGTWGIEVVPNPSESEAGRSGAERCVLYTALGATVAAAALDSTVTTPEAAMLRVVGLVVWVAAGFAVLRVIQRGIDPARPCIAGAAALAFSASLDLAPVQTSSAAWVMLVFALSSACAGSAGRGATERTFVAGRRGGLIPGGAALLVTAIMLAVGVRVLVHVARWESPLRMAADEVRATTMLRMRLVELSRGKTFEPGDTLEKWRESFVPLVEASPQSVRGLREARSWAELDRLLIARERAAWERAAATLALATPTPATVQSLSRLQLRLADAWVIENDEAARQKAATFFAAAFESAGRSLDQATAYAWRATVLESIGQVRTRERDAGRPWVDPPGLADLDPLRTGALIRALELDPFNPQHPARLAKLSSARGESDDARRWATLALELDGLRRLDPLRQFLPAERAELERLAAAELPAAGPKP